MLLPILYIAQSSTQGRGVFTSADIPANTTIEIAPVLVLNSEDRVLVEKTILYNYIFEWDDDGSQAVIALGYISMYNHSVHFNCNYEMDFDALTISVITCRAIKAGSELYINYNPIGKEDQPVWFNDFLQS